MLSFIERLERLYEAEYVDAEWRGVDAEWKSVSAIIFAQL